eukprot:TRINITY_DN6446_c0_g1_i4.p1 TRINITY_DN6446_c0_g1~~TRINITY_DN6446_c0_g1_i4.p1  ORF type:complete len:130 (-),score=8.46 TRINITY_DN6446_c0_g1_i4:89-478(-)
MRRRLLDSMPSNNVSPISGLTTHQKLVLCAATKLLLSCKGKKPNVNLTQLKKGYHKLYTHYLTVSDVEEQMSFSELYQMIPLLRVTGKPSADPSSRMVSLACPTEDMSRHFENDVLFYDIIHGSLDLLK